MRLQTDKRSRSRRSLDMLRSTMKVATKEADEFANVTSELCLPTKDQHVWHDMTRPLSEYFISCSHRTYVEGSSQITGKVGLKLLANVLRSGCRCVAWLASHLEEGGGAKEEEGVTTEQAHSRPRCTWPQFCCSYVCSGVCDCACETVCGPQGSGVRRVGRPGRASGVFW